MPTRLAINGAAGRMGRRLIALGNADPDLRIAAALESPACPRLSDDAGTLAGIEPLGVPISAGLETDVDVVIDFSLPAGTDAALAVSLEKKLPLVVATTALSAEQLKKLDDASKEIPLLFAPNMSLAVNLGMKLVEVASEALKGQDADVEIIERHHRFKEDSPSGTALKFGQIVADRMGQTQHQHGREGRPGARPHNEIGYHAVRVGDNPGEHTIVFGLLGETVEVTVRASNRDCYAMGALAAAKFLIGRPVGMYSMKDVLAF